MTGGELASLIGAVGILLGSVVAIARMRSDTGQGIVTAVTGLTESQTKWMVWIEGQADDLRLTNTNLTGQLAKLELDLTGLTRRTDATLEGLRAELVEMTLQRDAAITVATEMRGEVSRLNDRVRGLELELARYKRSNGT